MKKLFYLLSFVTIFYSCKNEDTPTPVNGSISFSFSTQTKKSGRVNQTAAPAFALISIEDAQGKPVEQNKKIALTAFGKGFVSEALQLKQGDYKLTLFIITDLDDKALYASPLLGSDQASKVQHPLPIGFSVGTGTLTITPEVLAVGETDTPESFGYVNFGFNVVTPPPTAKIKQLKSYITFNYNDEIQYFLPTTKLSLNYNDQGKLFITYIENVLTHQVNYINQLSYNNDNSIASDSIWLGPDDYKYFFSYRFTYANGLLSKVSAYNPNTKGNSLDWDDSYDYSVPNYLTYTEHIYGNQNVDLKIESALDGKGNIITQKDFDVYYNLMSTTNYAYGNVQNPIHNVFSYTSTEPEFYSPYCILKATTVEKGGTTTSSIDYAWTYDQDGYPSQLIKTWTNSDNEVCNREMRRFYY